MESTLKLHGNHVHAINHTYALDERAKDKFVQRFTDEASLSKLVIASYCRYHQS